MSILIILIGIILPSILGWLLLRSAEWKQVVLSRGERAAWAVIIGPTAMTLLTFVCTSVGVLRITFVGFLIPLLIISIGLLIILKKHGIELIPKDGQEECQDAWSPGVWGKRVMFLLLLWAGLKILAGSYDALLTPTYWDDSFNNWNMRAKMFFVEESLVLEIPTGNGITQTAQGVSSYPPALPLVKTWLMTIQGNWSEGVANGVQVVWYLAMLAALFVALRRHYGRWMAWGGAYLLSSLPLLFIHGVNPYGEVFLASHLLIVIITCMRLAQAKELEIFRTWVKILGLAFGIFLFTKNEATVLYAPVLLLIIVAIVWKEKSLVREMKDFLRLLLPGVLILVGLAFPWILFKWLQGLTFGNAKAVSGISLGFSPLALQAIWFQLTSAPNIAFVPTLTLLALIGTKLRCLKLPNGVPLLFGLGAFLLQSLAFTFVTSLWNEAILQTGLSRGMLHLAPALALGIAVTFSGYLTESR